MNLIQLFALVGYSRIDSFDLLIDEWAFTCCAWKAWSYGDVENFARYFDGGSISRTGWHFHVSYSASWPAAFLHCYFHAIEEQVKRYLVALYRYLRTNHWKNLLIFFFCVVKMFVKVQFLSKKIVTIFMVFRSKLHYSYHCFQWLFLAIWLINFIDDVNKNTHWSEKFKFRSLSCNSFSFLLRMESSSVLKADCNSVS